MAIGKHLFGKQTIGK